MSGKKEAVRGGIGLGSALAVVISWSQHQSILWAIIHGVLSWFYVIYYAVDTLPRRAAEPGPDPGTLPRASEMGGDD